MACRNNLSLHVFNLIVMENSKGSSRKFIATIAILSFLFLKAVVIILFELETLLILCTLSADS